MVEAHYTFDLEPMTMDERREWFGHYAETGRHRLFVALDDGHLGGYASSSRFRNKPAYETSVESENLHRAYAGIALPNPASIALHERFGFKRVAHFSQQGRKFGRYWDVTWFEKPLGGTQ